MDKAKESAAVRKRIDEFLASVVILESKPKIEPLWSSFVPLWERVSDQVGEIITDMEFFVFLYGHVSDVAKQVTSKAGEEGHLDKLVASEKLNALGDFLQKFLDSLPRQYDVFFWVPQFSEIEIGQIAVADGIRIVKVVDGHTGEVPALLSWHSSRPEQEGLKEGGYLVIRVKGFGDSKFSSSAVSQALAKLKQVVNVGFLEGRLEFEYAKKCAHLLFTPCEIAAPKVGEF